MNHQEVRKKFIAELPFLVGKLKLNKELEKELENHPKHVYMKTVGVSKVK
jgi:hypothetical protein